MPQPFFGPAVLSKLPPNFSSLTLCSRVRHPPSPRTASLAAQALLRSTRHRHALVPVALAAGWGARLLTAGCPVAPPVACRCMAGRPAADGHAAAADGLSATDGPVLKGMPATQQRVPDAAAGSVPPRPPAATPAERTTATAAAGSSQRQPLGSSAVSAASASAGLDAAAWQLGDLQLNGAPPLPGPDSGSQTSLPGSQSPALTFQVLAVGMTECRVHSQTRMHQTAHSQSWVVDGGKELDSLC